MLKRIRLVTYMNFSSQYSSQGNPAKIQEKYDESEKYRILADNFKTKHFVTAFNLGQNKVD